VRCKVSASPSPYVDWTRNAEPIQPGDRYIIQADGLLIPDVNDGDDGVYTCRALVLQTGQLESRNIHVEVNTIMNRNLFESFKYSKKVLMLVFMTLTSNRKKMSNWLKQLTH